MDLGLAGARVVVTGGASNIGRGIVHVFAAEGSRIVISDIDKPQAERVRGEAQARGAADVELAIDDLTVPGGAESAIGTAVENWGGIDVLVNNAGWSVPGFIATDTDRDKWQRTIEINLFSAVAATQAAIGPMKEAGGGAIAFIASDAAFGQIRQGIYGASKAAVVALARTVAREHGRHGIRSNIICPGLVIPEGPEAVEPLGRRTGQRVQPRPDRLHGQGDPAAPPDHRRGRRPGHCVVLFTDVGSAGDRAAHLGQRRLHDSLDGPSRLLIRRRDYRNTPDRAVGDTPAPNSAAARSGRGTRCRRRTRPDNLPRTRR
jgi:2-hydroxycyclohexanecarboxyl-CoA dehydrogenase